MLLGASSPGAARARGTRTDVKRGSALPAVSCVHTRSALQETANGLGAPCPDRPMQWSHAGLVLVLDVGSGIEEELDYQALFRRIPRLPRPGPCIARVMESGCSTSILSVLVSSSVDQSFDHERAESRRGNVERRISGV